MKAKDLKEGDILTVCGVEWTVKEQQPAATFFAAHNGERTTLWHHIIDTWLDNGATVRREGPITTTAKVNSGTTNYLTTDGLCAMIREAGWPDGTKVKITVEKL